MKSFVRVLVLWLLFGALLCWAQRDSGNSQTSQTSNPATTQAQSGANPIEQVAESTKAIDYRQGSRSELAMKGSDQMADVNGTADIDTK